MRQFIFVILLFTLFTGARAQDNIEVLTSRSEKNRKSEQYYSIATALYHNGKYEKAIKYYDSAINLNVRRLDLYLSRAEVKESIGNYVAALVDYATIIEIDREDPYAINAYFKRGLIYHRQNNYLFAISDFTHLLDMDDFGETRTMIFKGIQQNEGGEVEFAGVTTVEKLRADVFDARAQSYQMLGEEKKALLDFERAIAYNSSEPVYYVNRGVVLLQSHDTIEAKKDFIKALEIKPGYKPALFNLSKISTIAERESFKKELYADNEVSVLFSHRAYEKFLDGDYKGALMDYDSALFWMPKNAEVLMNRGIINSKLKRPRSAIVDFDKSVKLDKKLYRNYFLIGNAFQGLKDYRNAITYYEFYISTEGNDAQAYYNKGVAELSLGNKKQACLDLTKALNMGEEKAKKAKEAACQ
jgi:tetratricopeptide (TPR) repeat protein